MLRDLGKETVVSALESFSQRTQELSSRIDGRSRINPFETGELQALYSALKFDVKAASKRGKVENGKYDQTDWERYYFAPAMMKAASSLRARTSTNPLTSNWLGSLQDAGMEFSYYLHQLEKSSPPGQ